MDPAAITVPHYPYATISLCLSAYIFTNPVSGIYANDGMVVSSDPAWLQGAFSALVAIFGRVGLRTNVGKTVSMACQPFRVGDGHRTEAAYSRRLTGLGETYAER